MCVRHPFTNLKIALPNFAMVVTSSGEVGGGGVATFHASFLGPAGGWVPFTFSGQLGGDCPDNTFIFTDFINTVPVAVGDKFKIRIHMITTGTIVYWFNSTANGGIDGISEDKMTVSATTTPDLTDGSPFTSGVVSAVAIGLYPIAVLSKTVNTNRSFLILGDSRASGSYDTQDRNLDTGEIARSIGARRPYISMACPSDRMSFWATSNTNRSQLAIYCTDAIIQYGINDLNVPRTAAQLIADAITVIAKLKAVNPAIRIFVCTIAPYASSSDSFAVTANQTTQTSNAQRVLYNNWVRNTINVKNLNGYIDLADVQENVRDGGLWLLNGIAGYFTADGLHTTQQGYLRIRYSGVVQDSVGL